MRKRSCLLRLPIGAFLKVVNLVAEMVAILVLAVGILHRPELTAEALAVAVKGIKLCEPQKDVKPNYGYFPVVFDEKNFGATRNEVFLALAENGINARKYFYPISNTFECFHGKYDVNETPVAFHISKRVLTLPLYADLSAEVVDRICDIILGLAKAD